jgi:cation diffusion facilitator CzcD-associated flavoprotein CzcO
MADVRHAPRVRATRVHDTLIVGAGFTGIGTAIKLTEADVDDFVILERGDRVGGTWRDNTYHARTSTTWSSTSTCAAASGSVSR